MSETPKHLPLPEHRLIGWREYVDLPDWNLRQIKAKADTGARSSAIDVAEIVELPGDRVRFVVVADRRASGERQDGERQTIETEIVRRTRVRSSFGAAHDRLFVRTTIRLAGRELDVELGLVSRKAMLCRMLLGRKSLEGIFLVDSGRKYLHGRRRRRRRPKPT